MDFKSQITNLKIVTVTKPRTYLQWNNTEEGRDKYDCYERIDEKDYVRWVNTHNTSTSIISGDRMFNILEEMYQSALENVNNIGREIKVVPTDGKYGVIDDGVLAVPFIYDNEKDAISEWEYFERLNTESKPHHRFLGHVTPIEFIDAIIAKYNM
jgi:hypothetical protein